MAETRAPVHQASGCWPSWNARAARNDRDVAHRDAVRGRLPRAALERHDAGGDHAFYLSHAVGFPYDLLIEDITVDGWARASASRLGTAPARVTFVNDSFR